MAKDREKYLRSEIARSKGNRKAAFQKKLDDLLAGKGEVSTPAAPTSQEKAKATISEAEKVGKEFAEKYLPEGTFKPYAEGVSPEMAAILSNIANYVKGAQELSPLEQEAIAAQRAGLGGYTGPETEAMRSAALEEMNRAYLTQLRQQQIAQGRAGVRGAAAIAQQEDLGRARMEGVQDFERDLLIQNAQEQQRRKEAFSNLIRQTENARFGRTESGLGQQGQLQQAQDLLNFNIAQANEAGRLNEIATRGGIALGGAGLYTGLYSAEEASRIAEQQARDAARRDELIRRANEDAIKWNQQATNRILGTSRSF